MAAMEAYSKILCMSELSVQHHRYNEEHFFEADKGKSSSCFRYVVMGSTTVHSVYGSFDVTAGDLYYMPEGIRYHSVWSGMPSIEFYSFEVISRKYDFGSMTETYEPQKISGFSGKQAAQTFEKIFSLFRTDNRIEKIKAVGLYYSFYAEILPLMKQKTPSRYSDATLHAVEYIEENSACDFSMADLSTHCNISESRLYHLFCKEIGTSPMHYRNEVRVEKAAKLMRSSTMSLSEVCDAVGYNSLAYFRETFKQYTGMTPKAYQQVTGKDKQPNKDSTN